MRSFRTDPHLAAVDGASNEIEWLCSCFSLTINVDGVNGSCMYSNSCSDLMCSYVRRVAD